MTSDGQALVKGHCFWVEFLASGWPMVLSPTLGRLCIQPARGGTGCSFHFSHHDIVTSRPMTPARLMATPERSQDRGPTLGEEGTRFVTVGPPWRAVHKLKDDEDAHVSVTVTVATVQVG